MTQIGTVYAQALYSLAAEEGCTEEVLSALSALETSVEQEPEFLRLLSTPNLSKEERCKIIDDSFSGKMPEILLNFLKLLTEKGYARHLGECAKAYQRNTTAATTFCVWKLSPPCLSPGLRRTA